jgi:hypothetical protein
VSQLLLSQIIMQLRFKARGYKETLIPGSQIANTLGAVRDTNMQVMKAMGIKNKPPSNQQGSDSIPMACPPGQSNARRNLCSSGRNTSSSTRLL